MSFLPFNRQLMQQLYLNVALITGKNIGILCSFWTSGSFSVLFTLVSRPLTTTIFRAFLFRGCLVTWDLRVVVDLLFISCLLANLGESAILCLVDLVPGVKPVQLTSYRPVYCIADIRKIRITTNTGAW